MIFSKRHPDKSIVQKVKISDHLFWKDLPKDAKIRFLPDGVPPASDSFAAYYEREQSLPKPKLTLKDLIEKLKPSYPTEVEVADGLFYQVHTGAHMATCKCCDTRYDSGAGPEDVASWDPEMAYCGGSDRCCP